MSIHSVGKGTRVTLNFSLSLKDGAVVDSTFDKAPASLDVGDGSLPEGFESFIMGLKPGDHETYEVPPENAFGQANPNNRQSFKRSDFDRDTVIEPGLMVSFADASQSELPGVVYSVDADEVIVDFNHPLAGRDLIFEVEIIDVQPIQ
jgi:FKBP-type peptidyl-prolyl cis-trans isomerase SlpA